MLLIIIIIATWHHHLGTDSFYNARRLHSVQIVESTIDADGTDVDVAREKGV
jgi:hypothetical protein